MAIITLGSIAYDTIETVREKKQRLLGGSATYFSLAASLFTPTSIISIVGNDFTDEEMQIFRRKNIDVSNVVVSNEHKTFHWHGKYNETLSKVETISSETSILEEFKPKIKDKALACDILFLANMNPENQLEVMHDVRHKLCFCDSMDKWIIGKKELLREVFTKSFGVIINEDEALLFTEGSSLLKSILQINELGPRLVIIKRGEYGVCYFYQGKFFQFPAYPLLDVEDTTGAGDSFAGGFLGYLDSLLQQGRHQNKLLTDRSNGLLEGRDANRYIKESIIMGIVCASFTCSSFGITELNKVNLEKVRARYNSYLEMITI